MFQYACEKEEPKACMNIGRLFRYKHPGQSVGYFQKACANGQHQACLDLGEMYEQGEGVPEDIPGAKSLYDKACVAGLEKACISAKRLRGQ